MTLFDQLFQSGEGQASRDWPTVTGEVYSTSIQYRRGEESLPEITYSYSVNGEYYSGIYRIDFYSIKGDLNDFLAAFPPGTKILVHYRADKPEVSALFEDMDMRH